MPLRQCFVLRHVFAVVALVVSAGFASDAVADEAFPYTARISGTSVRVRSGPGKNYYVTQELQFGDEVEVYRHDPGGWYAVRPPQGSFSWVSSQYVRLIDEETATVIGQRVVARVGSQLNDARDVIQVRLDRDEQVRVLQSARVSDGATAQTWYKIAPPAGEFRWIYGKYVQKELRPAIAVSPRPSGNLLVEQLRQSTSPSRSEAPQPWAGDDVDRPLENDFAPSFADNGQERPDARRDVMLVRGEEDVSAMPRATANEAPFDGDTLDAGWSARASDEDTVLRPAPVRIAKRPETKHQAQADARPQNRTRGNFSGDPRQRAAELDLLLSSMVAEDPSRWDFRDLHAEAKSLLNASTTAVERGRARLLLKKIERFDDIRRRYGAVERLTIETAEHNRQLQTTAGRRDGPPETDDRYDGRGRLTRVVSRKLGAPRYALLSPAGEVLSYVTPAPGVNLRPYVGQQVGLTGSRGYMADYERQHVTAQRVSVLDRPLLR